MGKRFGSWVPHGAAIAMTAALASACMAYPFLPGPYDSLALPLSMMVQMGGAAGLLAVPVGLVWLVYEMRSATRRYRFAFALVSLAMSVLAACAVTFVAAATVGYSLAAAMLCLWAVAGIRLRQAIRRIRRGEPDSFHPAPVYLTALPLALLVIQWTLTEPLTAASRERAMAASAELIADIEAYRAANGRYPESLFAIWKDYSPKVAGIDRYHYAPGGGAYNLAFEQPRFLIDEIGAREFVVYHPRDRHAMFSHTAWILILTPEESLRAQGWFAVREAGAAHWKSFLFD